MTKDVPSDDADLYKCGIHLLMDDITADSCKDAIEFVLKQNAEKKKQKRLQFLICYNGNSILRKMQKKSRNERSKRNYIKKWATCSKGNLSKLRN